MHLQSVKFLFAGYLGIILIGTFLLSLPPMYHTNVSFLDALFTSTSAMTCTGLAVKNTGVDFTFHGQIVILCLVQIGGFGHMSMAGLLYLLIGKRLSPSEKDLINVVENLNNNSLNGINKAIVNALIFVLIVEIIGMALLIPYFHYKLGDIKQAIWIGVFHSITAFNNAGFTMLDNGLLPYQSDIFINVTISLLVIIGGLGYLSSIEISNYCYSSLRHNRIFAYKKHNMRLSLNTKIVIILSIILILSGIVNILVFEWHNERTLYKIPFWEKVLNSFFMSANYRTAGFNIFDISSFDDRTMFFSVFFMLIGGGPGGTASGIKVTTFAILVSLSISIVKSRKDVVILGRSIPQDIVSKAFCVFIIASVYFLVSTFLLSIFEPNVRFLPLLFESASAFSTTGLSMGDGGMLSLCANFNIMGLFITMFLMISGKIGILAFTLVFMGGAKTKYTQYPQERVLI